MLFWQLWQKPFSVEAGRTPQIWHLRTFTFVAMLHPLIEFFAPEL
jgi:hypothetical protein